MKKFYYVKKGPVPSSEVKPNSEKQDDKPLKKAVGSQPPVESKSSTEAPIPLAIKSSDNKKILLNDSNKIPLTGENNLRLIKLIKSKNAKRAKKNEIPIHLNAIPDSKFSEEDAVKINTMLAMLDSKVNRFTFTANPNLVYSKDFIRVLALACLSNFNQYSVVGSQEVLTFWEKPKGTIWANGSYKEQAIISNDETLCKDLFLSPPAPYPYRMEQTLDLPYYTLISNEKVEPVKLLVGGYDWFADPSKFQSQCVSYDLQEKSITFYANESLVESAIGFFLSKTITSEAVVTEFIKAMKNLHPKECVPTEVLMLNALYALQKYASLLSKSRPYFSKNYTASTALKIIQAIQQGRDPMIEISDKVDDYEIQLLFLISLTTVCCNLTYPGDIFRITASILFGLVQRQIGHYKGVSASAKQYLMQYFEIITHDTKVSTRLTTAVTAVFVSFVQTLRFIEGVDYPFDGVGDSILYNWFDFKLTYLKVIPVICSLMHLYHVNENELINAFNKPKFKKFSCPQCHHEIEDPKFLARERIKDSKLCKKRIKKNQHKPEKNEKPHISSSDDSDSDGDVTTTKERKALEKEKHRIIKDETPVVGILKEQKLSDIVDLSQREKEYAEDLKKVQEYIQKHGPDVKPNKYIEEEQKLKDEDPVGYEARLKAIMNGNPQGALTDNEIKNLLQKEKTSKVEAEKGCVIRVEEVSKGRQFDVNYGLPQIVRAMEGRIPLIGTIAKEHLEAFSHPYWMSYITRDMDPKDFVATPKMLQDLNSLINASILHQAEIVNKKVKTLKPDVNTEVDWYTLFNTAEEVRLTNQPYHLLCPMSPYTDLNPEAQLVMYSYHPNYRERILDMCKKEKHVTWAGWLLKGRVPYVYSHDVMTFFGAASKRLMGLFQKNKDLENKDVKFDFDKHLPLKNDYQFYDSKDKNIKCTEKIRSFPFTTQRILTAAKTAMIGTIISMTSILSKIPVKTAQEVVNDQKSKKKRDKYDFILIRSGGMSDRELDKNQKNASLFIKKEWYTIFSEWKAARLITNCPWSVLRKTIQISLWLITALKKIYSIERLSDMAEPFAAAYASGVNASELGNMYRAAMDTMRAFQN